MTEEQVAAPIPAVLSHHKLRSGARVSPASDSRAASPTGSAPPEQSETDGCRYPAEVGHAAARSEEEMDRQPRRKQRRPEFNQPNARRDQARKFDDDAETEARSSTTEAGRGGCRRRH